MPSGFPGKNEKNGDSTPARPVKNVRRITTVIGSRHRMRVDLNADVGESCGQDSALMPHITSANVACGFHAGDPGVMRDTVILAREHGVAIGAHPGFPDRDGFGRRDLHLTPRQIEDLVVYQVGALAAIAAAQGIRLQHVKPHGALFNIAVRDRAVADAIARATASVDRSLILFGLPDSELTAAARRRDCAPRAKRSPTARIEPTERWCRGGNRAPSSTIRRRSFGAP